jgi:hypothetical protein
MTSRKEFIHAFARTVCPSSANRRYMAMLSLYLDDSGNQSSGRVFAVGGFVGNEHQWQRLDRQWDVALRQFNLPFFHSSELYPRQIPPFDKWSNEKHARVSGRFTSIAVSQTAAAVGRGVELPAYLELDFAKNMKAHLPATLRSRGLRPIMFCTRMCLEWIARDWPNRPKNELIAVVFEQGAEGLGDTEEYFWHLHKTYTWAKVFCSFTRALKSQVRPLEAADLMAWLTHKELGKELQLSGQPTHKGLQRIANEKRLSIKIARRKS